MKELSPHKQLTTVQFSPSTQECLDKVNGELIEENLTGTIFQDGVLSCITKGSSLELVNNKTGKRKAACDFQQSNLKCSVTTTCTFGKKLLVALKYHDSTKGGLLCLFDQGKSRVVETISIPYVPVSLALIKQFGGAGEGPSLFSVSLKCMFGVVAVGSDNGHIYLVDMRLDESFEVMSSGKPNQLLIIDPAEVGNIAVAREQARKTGRHCCIDLSYSLCSTNAFKYIGIEGEIMKVCSSGDCTVSALMFSKETCSLVVGYSFGCYQIWSMQHFCLLYSSQPGFYTSPVTNFTFQEPDDDPRHCCYLWVGRGPTQYQTELVGPSSITLYQMAYEFKETKTDHGNLYKNLECVIRRFDHQLTSDVHHLVDSRSIGSRIVTLKTLDQPSSYMQNYDDLETRNVNMRDTTICYVVWETPSTSEDESMSCHLGVFDINKWYQKQLPASIRDAMYGRMEAVCPFFAFYSLTDVAEAFLPNGVLDTYIDTKTINTFRNVEGPQSEQFYWPSSSSFKVVCLSENSSIETVMLGIQRQIIAEIRDMGTDSFLDAPELVKSCWVAGLLQNSVDVTKLSGEKRNTDAMLSVSLEHNGIAFITSCIKQWSNGSITHSGHSLKLIYDWAWNRVIQYKKMLDQLHIPIFCSLTEKLEIEQISQIKRLSLELENLCSIFKELKRCRPLTVEEGVEELEARIDITTYLSLYCDVLLLLIDSGLLPEQPGKYETSSSDKITYPYKMLMNYYETHRKKLTDTADKKDNLTLFIDSTWKKLTPLESSSSDAILSDEEKIIHEYPPQSIEVMCRLFLQNTSTDEMQTNLFYYWILDISECYEELQQLKFASKIKECLKLNKKKSLLMEALWLLDHDLFKEAAEHLSLIEAKIPSYYYHQIVQMLYGHNELSLLTLFCSTKQPEDIYSVEETEFLIQILLRIKMLPIAYKIQHDFCTQSKKKELFHYFAQKCKENRMLSKLITLSLSADEEVYLRSYLELSNDNADYLLVYYLERGLFSEAAAMAKQLKNSFQLDVDRLAHEYTAAKCLLVDGFLRVVPDIQKKRLSLMNSTAKSSSPTVKPPLSTVIRRVGQHQEFPTFMRSTFNRLYGGDIKDIFKSKGFFEDSLISNQRRRKSPLFNSEVISPTKKLKESQPVALKVPITQTASPVRGRKNLFTGSDAYLLLRTPPVSRKSKAFTVNKDNSKTPQSILKSRFVSRLSSNKKHPAASPRKVQMFNVKPDVTSFTPGKKIRFIGLQSPTSPLSSPLLGESPEMTSSPEISLPVVDSKPTRNISWNSSTASNDTIEFKSPEVQFKSPEVEFQSPEAQFEGSDTMPDIDGSFQETLPKNLTRSLNANLTPELEHFIDQERDDQFNTSTVDEILIALSERENTDNIPEDSDSHAVVVTQKISSISSQQVAMQSSPLTTELDIDNNILSEKISMESTDVPSSLEQIDAIEKTAESNQQPDNEKKSFEQLKVSVDQSATTINQNEVVEIIESDDSDEVEESEEEEDSEEELDSEEEEEEEEESDVDIYNDLVDSSPMDVDVNTETHSINQNGNEEYTDDKESSKHDEEIEAAQVSDPSMFLLDESFENEPIPEPVMVDTPPENLIEVSSNDLDSSIETANQASVLQINMTDIRQAEIKTMEDESIMEAVYVLEANTTGLRHAHVKITHDSVVYPSFLNQDNQINVTEDASIVFDNLKENSILPDIAEHSSTNTHVVDTGIIEQSLIVMDKHVDGDELDYVVTDAEKPVIHPDDTESHLVLPALQSFPERQQLLIDSISDDTNSLVTGSSLAKPVVMLDSSSTGRDLSEDVSQKSATSSKEFNIVREDEKLSTELEMPPLFESMIHDDNDAHIFASSTMIGEPNMTSLLDESVSQLVHQSEVDALPMSSKIDTNKTSTVKKEPQKRQPSRRVTRSATKKLNDTLNETVMSENSFNTSIMTNDASTFNTRKNITRSRRKKDELLPIAETHKEPASPSRNTRSKSVKANTSLKSTHSIISQSETAAVAISPLESSCTTNSRSLRSRTIPNISDLQDSETEKKCNKSEIEEEEQKTLHSHLTQSKTPMKKKRESSKVDDSLNKSVPRTTRQTRRTTSNNTELNSSIDVREEKATTLRKTLPVKIDEESFQAPETPPLRINSKKKKAESKVDDPKESILSFTKTLSKEYRKPDTPRLISKRSSSRRASLAISEQSNLSRRSLRPRTSLAPTK